MVSFKFVKFVPIVLLLASPALAQTYGIGKAPTPWTLASTRPAKHLEQTVWSPTKGTSRPQPNNRPRMPAWCRHVQIAVLANANETDHLT